MIWRMLGEFLYFIKSGPVMPSVIGSKSLWNKILRLFTMFGKNVFKTSAVSDSDLTIFAFSNNLSVLLRPTYLILKVLQFSRIACYLYLLLLKKWNFPLRISSVNVTKSAVFWRNSQWKTSSFVQCFFSSAVFLFSIS